MGKIAGLLLLMFTMLVGCGCSSFYGNSHPKPNNIRESYYFPENRPREIVLMLPLTGTFASTSKFIRGGFMAAYYFDSAEKSNLNIKIVDTNGENIETLYQRAVTDGTELIVGPLAKNDVEFLSKLSIHPVPIVALNTLDNYTYNYNANLYQFGLIPQDEAVQTAGEMIKDGITLCAIINPSGPWGKKITTAFRQTYESLGGTVVDTLLYDNHPGLSQQLCQFIAENPDELCIDQAKEKPKIQKEENDKMEKKEPRRRQDINGIFLVTTVNTARQIVPLLKFYYASDLPIYAISSIYSGTNVPMLDQDINDVYFCDMPWVLRKSSFHNEEMQYLYNQFEEIKDKRTVNSKRLYALGIDAYRIATKLNYFLHQSSSGLEGMTGKLYLDNFNHIYRKLDWAKIHHGKLLPKF